MVIGALALVSSVGVFTGRVTKGQESMRDLLVGQAEVIKDQGRAIITLSERIARLEEALRVYQAWTGRAEK